MENDGIRYDVPSVCDAMVEEVGDAETVMYRRSGCLCIATYHIARLVVVLVVLVLMWVCGMCL